MEREQQKFGWIFQLGASEEVYKVSPNNMTRGFSAVEEINIVIWIMMFE